MTTGRPHRRWAIEPYIGYGTPTKLVVPGRVLEERGPILSAKVDSRWRNLRNTFRRFATDEVGGARVRARFGDVQAVALTDAEGYFIVELAADASLPTRWCSVELQLDRVDGPQNAAPVMSEVLVPRPTARFGVISDIDDTVVTTNVTSTWKMLSTVLLSNAHVRLPFRGIAAFYRALHDGVTGTEGNPIFYVSNGPWNFFALLVEFLKLSGIPLGPIFLRDFGPHLLFGSKRSHGGHKLLHIERILETYDALPFVLIGDSGERDPEIYREVVNRHPRRIRAIYIRSVDPRPERLAALASLAESVQGTSTQFVLASDSAFSAAHAAGEGLIAPSALAQVANDGKL